MQWLPRAAPPGVQPIVSPEEIIHARSVVNAIYVDDRIKEYIVNVVWATRDPAGVKLKLDGMIRFGASPRATIYLTLAAKAQLSSLAAGM